MSEKVQYDDFILELRDLDANKSKFKIAVLPSSAFGELEAQSVEYSEEKLQDTLTQLETKDIQLQGLIDLGKNLADLLLPEKVRSLFLEALKQTNKCKRIRLRLIIREKELANLPWEYIYLKITSEGADDGRYFLALNPSVSLVRHEPLPSAWHHQLPDTLDRGLKLLAVTAQSREDAPLELSKERKAIENALKKAASHGVKIDYEPFLKNPRIQDLQIALNERKPELFHFGGHGFFGLSNDVLMINGDQDDGYIVLIRDKTTRSPKDVSAGHLALHLKNAGIKVAVLGVCYSGGRGESDIWAGIAPALIEQGIPVVVAMQYEVVDTAAINFNQMFYESLALGFSIDEAVTAGRLAMLADNNLFEWGIPVLYMRSVNGELFLLRNDLFKERRQDIKEFQIRLSSKINSGKMIGIKAKSTKDLDGIFNIELETDKNRQEITGIDFTGKNSSKKD